MRIWLKKIREENGLTQQDVAELADVERTTYASIEQGRRNPSVVNAMRIASVLDFEWTIFDDKVREKSHFCLNEKQEVRKWK